MAALQGAQQHMPCDGSKKRRANFATPSVTPGQPVTSKSLSCRTVVRGQWDDELKVLGEAQDWERQLRSSY